MPSFDVVCELNWAEVDNALNQAQKELSQRYDFRGTEAQLEKTDAGIVVSANSEDRCRAALDVFHDKLVRRKVSFSYFDPEDPKPGAKNIVKILVKVKEGIDRDDAKQIVQLVKDSKLKAQASIQESMVRVTSKKKDDLQAVIQLLRSSELRLDLQYRNFRD
jgi:uncharacterized protein YajQ (UPF0234 family)